MKRRTLRRRYGRAKGHLPLSRMSLATYRQELAKALRWVGQSPRLTAEEDRLAELRGWENGAKPIITAIKIEKLRRARSGR